MASRIGGSLIPPRLSTAEVAPAESPAAVAAVAPQQDVEAAEVEAENWDAPVSRERSSRLDPLIDPMNPNRAYLPPGGVAAVPQAVPLVRTPSAAAPGPMEMIGVKITQLGNSLNGTRRLSMLPEACNVIVRDIGKFQDEVVQHALLMTLTSRLAYLTKEPVADSPAQAAVMRAAHAAFEGELGAALEKFKRLPGTAEALQQADHYVQRVMLIESKLV